MKTYLITGAAGFIGSHLAEYLLNEGNRVINIDNFNEFYNTERKIRNVLESVKYTGNDGISLENLKKCVDSKNYTLYKADIRNMEEIEEIFKNNKIDFVINLAAMAGVRPSLENPALYEEVNVKGLINMFEVCKKYGVNKFIQASSSSVYGNSKNEFFKETDIVDFAISPYAATKKSGEIMGHAYYKLYEIDMIHLRFFTVYGPRQRPDLAIYKFTKSITEGKEIPFFGDGSTERDYTFIEDIIDGIVKSIKYLENNKGVYEILNLGENQTISLSRMVSTIEKELNMKAVLKRLPMQPGDVLRTSADITKAKQLIGYAPKVKFEEGIRRFVKWFRESGK